MLKLKTIGLLDGTEATRIYAPRKRTIAFLSKIKLDQLGVRMDVDTDRWEDVVAPYAEILYLSFPWVIFHRSFKEGLNSNLWVAFAKRYPQKGDLVFCPTLPNIDPPYITQHCHGKSLTDQIQLFWSSYFMLDEHPYGIRYGQLIFGGFVPPVEEELEDELVAAKMEKLRRSSGGVYYERWLKLEPNEVCEALRPMPGYSGVPIEEFLVKNMSVFDPSFEERYKLLIGDEDGSE